MTWRGELETWAIKDMQRGAQVALTNALEGLRKMRQMAAGSNQEPGLDIAITFMESLIAAGEVEQS
jgi:hypothetical protein